MALQAIVRWLLPREDHFYSLLESQADACHAAAMALLKSKDPSSRPEDVRDAVQVIEHFADDLVRQMEDALARTFVTPLDREDLHKLSSELDDVIDLTNLAARASVLYGVSRPTEPMQKLMDTLVECTIVLKTALPKLRHHKYAELLEDGRKLRALEKEADGVFRAAVSQLFKDPAVDAKVLLREKEVLEDLENAVDHCDDVAGTLANIAVKHG
jgi:uncharacterized protein Yka (UPF0111/DUF47 family)